MRGRAVESPGGAGNDRYHVAMTSAFTNGLKIVAQLFSFIVLAQGAWFAAQGAVFPHSVLALLIGGFNLIILTRQQLQTASRFFLLVPGVFGFIIGAITLGGAVGLWTQGETTPPLVMILAGVSYALAGFCTVLWLLLVAPYRPVEGP